MSARHWAVAPGSLTCQLVLGVGGGIPHSLANETLELVVEA